MNREILTEKHSFLNDLIFRCKAFGLTLIRAVKNLFSSVKTHPRNSKLTEADIVAISESNLWNPFDNVDNWMLTAGKIENLRIASTYINGIEVKAGEVFSFWKHIGNPNFGKGYVIGREIREGCIIPTIAGGLCQLSNALYDAALKANFTIVERHKHTKVIRGSLAEQDRDATVKWNYIDLRFKSSFDFRIEIELTSEKLFVLFKSKQKSNSEEVEIKNIPTSKLNDCYSCGNTACFKHPDKQNVPKEIETTTYILDEQWPEFDKYIQSRVTPKDTFILPLKKNSLLKTNRYTWNAAKSNLIKYVSFEGFYRALALRLYARQSANLFEKNLIFDKRLAQAAAKKIPIESTHIVVSQNIAPYLFQMGALGGRTYDVLMTRFPMEILHQKLDEAYLHFPSCKTLADFRAPKKLMELENKALTQARKIITPHLAIANCFKNKALILDWSIESIEKTNFKGNKILFPASAYGRKGAYLVRQLALDLNIPLVVLSSKQEVPDFWSGVEVTTFNGDFEDIGLVIYPAVIEHQPRLLLKAVALGIPVIASINCGIPVSPNLTLIEPFDLDRLKQNVLSLIGHTV